MKEGKWGKEGQGRRREERTGKDLSLLHELFSSGVLFDGSCVCWEAAGSVRGTKV